MRCPRCGKDVMAKYNSHTETALSVWTRYTYTCVCGWQASKTVQTVRGVCPTNNDESDEQVKLMHGD